MRKNNLTTSLNIVHNKKFPLCSRHISALACAGLLAVSTVSCGKPSEPADSTDITLTPSADQTSVPDPTDVPELSSDNNISPEDNTNTITPTENPSSAPTPTTPPPAPAVYGIPNQTSVYSATESNYTLAVDASNAVHEISDMLYGIFIEDINFAADGGLYAELIQNRSFEFTSLASGNEKHAWKNVGEVTANVVKDDADGCLNANNPNYMVIENTSDAPAGIANTGFLDGMAVAQDAEYLFSIYARGIDGYSGAIYVELLSGTDVIASKTIDTITADWVKYNLSLTSSATATKNVSLQVTINNGSVAVDMVSLFPKDTFKGRENGLRQDLAEKLEALNPTFLRFPGGCVIEGVTLDAAYDWKDSIGVGSDGEPLLFNGTYGDVAARRQGQNIWTDERATNDKYPDRKSVV